MSLGMKEICFGIEIECIGHRAQVAKAIQRVVGGSISDNSSNRVTDRRGRLWKVVYDGSISAMPEYRSEVVSPILHYEDIPELQEVIRSIRKVAKARVNDSCGIHIHVSSAAFNAKAVCNLVKMMNKQEFLIEKALDIKANRRIQYCKRIDQDFLQKIENRRMTTMRDLNTAWYGYSNPNPDRYNNTRYSALNLNSMFVRNTVEFRCFNSTLHAGKVKANLQFSLALAAKALRMKSASSKRRDYNSKSEKYSFRCFLLSLGLIGEEFKTARKHLMANLSGSAAWRNGRPQNETRTLAEAA